MKLTVKRLLARYAQDPELQEILGQLDDALKSGELAEVILVMLAKDGTFMVSTTIQNPYAALGLLAAAQSQLVSSEEED